MRTMRGLFLPLVCGLFQLSTSPSTGQWDRQNSGTNVTLRSVAFADSSHGIIVGDSGIVLRTTNGGGIWERQSSGTKRTLYAITLLDASTGTAVGDSGAVIRTTNGGVNWLQQSSGTNNVLRGVAFGDANSGLAIGESGTILRTTNGGTTWRIMTLDSTFDAFGVCFTNPAVGTVVGERRTEGNWLRGAIATTTDTGVTWLFRSIDVMPLRGISFANENNGLAVGVGALGRAQSLRTTDGGAMWTSSIPSWGDLFAVSYIDSAHATAVGWDSFSIILRTTDGGVTWDLRYSESVTCLYGVCFTDSRTGTAVGTEGAILRTTSGGVTWAQDQAKSHLTAPSTFVLEQNFPNPFNPTTVISYQLPVVSYVKLSVFDMLGQEVRVLVDEKKEAGYHEIRFDGSGLASGVYLYRLQTGKYVATKKLVLMK